MINLVLATGRIGQEGSGYGTLTGQGNGQGGREHGQKADQLPGGRDIENPEHRAHIARLWGIDEAELPHQGTHFVEMIGQMERGEIKGLIGFCNNPFVSLPNRASVVRGYDALEFHAQADLFCPRPPHEPTSCSRRRRGRRTRARIRTPRRAS